MRTPAIGDVRIIKCDDRNYAVQQYRAIVNNKTGDVRLDWADAGYYGDKLQWAVESALMVKVPEGKDLLGEFKKAAADIIEVIANA